MNGPLDWILGDGGDKVFRANVGRLFSAYAALLKDTGLTRPRTGMDMLRSAVLQNMKGYNSWRQTVLELPPGQISEPSKRQLVRWAGQYRGLRAEVAKALARSGGTLRAPRVEDITAVPARSASSAFGTGLKSGAVLAGLAVAVLYFVLRRNPSMG